MITTKIKVPPLMAVILAGLLLGASTASDAQSKRVFGRSEAVRLEPEGIVIVALLDTGASTTSLDARAIRLVDRDGKSWVEFEYHEGGRVTPMARPLVRVSRLRASPLSDTVSRPVVLLQLCMGDIQREVQVNLVDRSKMRSRMLIGRNFLIPGQVIVDAAIKMTSQPSCTGSSG